MKELQRLKNENDNEYLEKLTKFLDEEVDKSVLLIKRKKEERLRNFKNDLENTIYNRNIFKNYYGKKIIFKKPCVFSNKNNNFNNNNNYVPLTRVERIIDDFFTDK